MVEGSGMKQAIRRAERAIAQMFAEEGPTDIRLEEVDRDEQGRWRITIGFLLGTGPPQPVSALFGGTRDYKVVTAGSDGSVHAIECRGRVAGAGCRSPSIPISGCSSGSAAPSVARSRSTSGSADASSGGSIGSGSRTSGS